MTCAILLSALAGCSSIGAATAPSAYADAGCSELNVAIGTTSKEISAAAITRGKIDRFNVPFWVPGGRQAAGVLKDRQSRRIEGLENRLSELRSARGTRCLQR
jgi:hypothetical protein